MDSADLAVQLRTGLHLLSQMKSDVEAKTKSDQVIFTKHSYILGDHASFTVVVPESGERFVVFVQKSHLA